MHYYTIPIRTDQLMRGKALDKTDVRRSIHQHIGLMLKTLSLSYRFDPSYGSVLNKFHALTPPQGRSQRLWMEELRERIQKNLHEMLTRYETRIVVQEVFVDLDQPPAHATEPVLRVRVRVHGDLSLGRKEKFHYPDSEVAEDAMEALPLLIPIGKK